MNHCAFTAGYLEAMAFTDMSDLDDEARDCELSAELRTQAESDCERFQIEAAALLDQAYEPGDYDAEQAGRDFWFTRCGHGVGFWDRPELNEGSMAPSPGGLGEKLSAIATGFGNLDVYRGDDGKAYTA